MLSRPLPRFAIVATVLFSLASGPYFAQAAPADDSPQTAHELAVLDRIFANWKARHDRVHSLHVTLDLRVVWKERTPEFSGGERKLRAHDEELRRTGMQLWIEGEDHVCLAGTPSIKMPSAKQIDPRQVVMRQVIIGQICSREFLGPRSATEPADRSHFVRHAFVERDPLGDPRTPEPLFRPLFLAFRPQYPTLAWQKEQCRFVDSNALLDGSRAVEFQRTVKPGHGYTDHGKESCWVSPVRNDVVARWKMEGPGGCETAIHYKKDPTCGWFPIEWTLAVTNEYFVECKVTDYAINEKIDPTVFSQTFPPGTPVLEQMDAANPGKIEHYVVQPDGSKRAISSEEFARLINGTAPAK
jgi:hypothetical protein